MGDLKTDADYNQLVQDIQPHIIAVTSDDPQIENKRLQAKRVGALLGGLISGKNGKTHIPHPFIY